MKRKTKNAIYRIFIIFFSAIFIYSGYKVISYYAEGHKQKGEFDRLNEIVKQSYVSSDDKLEASEESLNSSDVFKGYKELASQNSDMVGWIKIDGTNINYPVMQSVDNPNFYLHHNFNKEYSDYGVPFIQENCSLNPQSDNVVIYGHHMKDGTMFADLNKYTDENFYREHKIITFNTLDELGRYEVINVFKTVAEEGSPDNFKYYNFTDASDEAEFNDFINKCGELALYDTGVKAKYGDKLITLSTCEYSHENGRLVVVAKKINN